MTRFGVRLPVLWQTPVSLAQFEYPSQVPARRTGKGEMNLARLKIPQGATAPAVFVPFVIFLHESIVQA